jgi:UDP-GlcNAc:undecaprenyl-phosphate GlcNAc-1-phosphate transferase
MFLVITLLACTIVTLAPLSRRKAVEAASQLAPSDPGHRDTTALLDPLDEASEKAEETV